jgi:hypothetical protein
LVKFQPDDAGCCVYICTAAGPNVIPPPPARPPAHAAPDNAGPNKGSFDLFNYTSEDVELSGNVEYEFSRDAAVVTITFFCVIFGVGFSVSKS